MEKELIKNCEWTLITIDDPTFLSSESLIHIFTLLKKKIEFKFVIINDINGTGKDWVISSLQKKENNTVFEIKEFLNILEDIKQLEWGDFFLFQEFPNWEKSEEITYYPRLIAQTDTTIRAVDNQYIYVYTPCQEIVKIVKENYEIESLKIGLLENLDYPY